jgi:hypothetical protein
MFRHPLSDGRAGRAAASAFTDCGHAVSWALGSNGPCMDGARGACMDGARGARGI